MCVVTNHRDELATRAPDDQQLLAIEASQKSRPVTVTGTKTTQAPLSVRGKPRRQHPDREQVTAVYERLVDIKSSFQVRSALASRHRNID